LTFLHYIVGRSRSRIKITQLRNTEISHSTQESVVYIFKIHDENQFFIVHVQYVFKEQRSRIFYSLTKYSNLLPSVSQIARTYCQIESKHFLLFYIILYIADLTKFGIFNKFYFILSGGIIYYFSEKSIMFLIMYKILYKIFLRKEEFQKNKMFQYTVQILKGQCHEIFDLWFFYQTNSPRPLIHGLKPFCIWLGIREDIRLRNRRFWLERCQ
jgi:hypothetical protein